MKMPERFELEQFAPCGVNCGSCSAFLAAKNPCPGCRAPKEQQKRKSCQNCVKKRCAAEKRVQWCFECEAFPCARIRSLNRHYTENYGIDLVQNGFDAKANSKAFLAAQYARFSCKTCGSVIDQHHKRCSECGGQAET